MGFKGRTPFFPNGEDPQTGEQHLCSRQLEKKLVCFCSLTCKETGLQEMLKKVIEKESEILSDRR